MHLFEIRSDYSHTPFVMVGVSLEIEDSVVLDTFVSHGNCVILALSMRRVGVYSFEFRE